MSVNGINSMMGPRMSTNLSVERQTPNTSFGARVNAGLNNVAGAVSGGLGTVAGMVPGGGIVSAAVSSMSTLNNSASVGAGSQYNAMAAGVTSVNTTVGGTGGGAPSSVGSSTSPGINLAADAMGSAGGPTGGVGQAVNSDPTLNAMFAEQKKLLGLQAKIGAESTQFQALSNVMKTRHESQKNAVGNIR